MGSFPLFFGFLMVVVVLSLALVRWWHDPKRVTKRRLEQAPATKISDVDDGAVVKVIGDLRYVGEPLCAPLSGRSCAYYEVRVQQKKGKNSWSTIIQEAAGARFLLTDDTGKALVELDDLGSAVVEDISFTSGTFNDPSFRAQSFLEKHGRESTNFLGFNKTLRYYEGVLEEGETIVVYGRARWEADPDPGPDPMSEDYRSFPKRLRLDAPEGGKMLVSDDPDVTR